MGCARARDRRLLSGLDVEHDLVALARYEQSARPSHTTESGQSRPRRNGMRSRSRRRSRAISHRRNATAEASG